MKRLYIRVEGQTEQEFVNSLIVPYLQRHGIYDVTPILIRTSKTGRGGFVNYQHLRNDVCRLLKSANDDFVVSMFVDFFRLVNKDLEPWTINTGVPVNKTRPRKNGLLDKIQLLQ